MNQGIVQVHRVSNNYVSRYSLVQHVHGAPIGREGGFSGEKMGTVRCHCILRGTPSETLNITFYFRRPGGQDWVPAVERKDVSSSFVMNLETRGDDVLPCVDYELIEFWMGAF